MVKIVVLVTTKLTLTCTNCGKTGRSADTCHNKKRKVPVVLIAIVKSIKHVARIKTQLVKSGKIHVRYPYIIYYSAKHRFGKCPKKIEVHNMFTSKPISYNVMTTPKLPKTNNVPVNVVAIVTIRSQQLKQQMFKERESIKAKGVEDWQQEKGLRNSFIETVK
jgi:hypothetical protein